MPRPHAKHIDRDRGRVQLSDGTIWEVKPRSLERLEFWTGQDQIKVQRSRHPDQQYPHDLVNLDNPGGSGPIRAKQVEEGDPFTQSWERP